MTGIATVEGLNFDSNYEILYNIWNVGDLLDAIEYIGKNPIHTQDIGNGKYVLVYKW